MGRPATCFCGECKKCTHRLYMREYYRRTRKRYVTVQKRRERERAAYHADPQKYKARMALASQVRRGIQTKGPCALCGGAETVGHHNDYMRPLEGTWLCASCHEMITTALPIG